MRNRWTINRETIIDWTAMFPRERVDDLAAFHRRVLSDGEDLAVYRVVAVPDLGFDRNVDGRLDDYLAADPHRDDAILLFDRLRTAATRLAFADAAGAVVEQDVTDLGAVLGAAPFEAPVRSQSPLDLDVWMPPLDGPVSVSVSTCSDIWLPWASARWEEDAESGDFADNRAFARRHTPRLNVFLSRLRELAVEMGGTWELDRHVTDRDLLFQVDDHGVLLDAENPLERISVYAVEGLGHEGLGRDGVLAALRGALRRTSRYPPPPPYHAVIRATVNINGHDHELSWADHAQLLDALRYPLDPGSRLTREELRGIAKVEVDNLTGRYAYKVGEIVD